MAGTKLENLVRGTSVVKDAFVHTQVGSKPAFARTIRLSHPRRLSLSLRTTGNQPGPRNYPVDTFDVDTSAIRTGRSASSVGVLVRRSPAMIAGLAVLSGRAIAVGGLTLAADGCFGKFRAKPPTAGGNDLLGCPLPQRFHEAERQQGSPAWCMPAAMSTASTRGTGDR